MQATQERRKYQRLDVNLNAKFSKMCILAEDKSFQPAEVVNLSAEGLFIKTGEPLQVGNLIEVTFWLAGNGKPTNPVRAEGIVRWSSDKPTEELSEGMGVEFLWRN